MKELKVNGNGTNGHTVIYSPEKIAEMLDVKKTFVTRQLREGNLNGFKMGKFWRVTQTSFEKYCSTASQNGDGKRGISAKTRARIQFHAQLRTKDKLPERVNKEVDAIQRLTEELPGLDRYQKIARIAKLRNFVRSKYQKEARLAGMEETLDRLAQQAYSDIDNLLEIDPEQLEEHLLRQMNGQPAKGAVNAE